MRDVKSAITSTINLLTGKSGTLWQRRYDAQAVVDDEGAAERHGYMTDNPRKAGLVDDSAHRPGLNLAYGFGDADELTLEYLDRTAWHKSGRPRVAWALGGRLRGRCLNGKHASASTPRVLRAGLWHYLDWCASARTWSPRVAAVPCRGSARPGGRGSHRHDARGRSTRGGRAERSVRRNDPSDGPESPSRIAHREPANAGG
ncbi:MAG: hypothetical protein PVI30_13395 [Myxococcales bacterium]